MNDPVGLDAASLDPWLRANIPPLSGGAPWSAQMISGGLSNITYRLTYPEGSLILRRPPLGQALPRAHDMAREHRIISALAGSPVPVPAPLGLCTDPAVLGAPFYVMDDIPGQVLRTGSDTAGLAPRVRRAVSEQLAHTLADLHAVDPDAVGLSDLARREGYSARIIKTWSQQWDRSRTRDLPDMARLQAQLSERLVPDRDNRVVHGDYRLDNTVFELEGHDPRLAGVLDWELATLGEPLADLGMTLTYWHDVDDEERAGIPVAAGVTAHPGFFTREEFAREYGRLSGRDISDLSFYVALGTMKLAVILEGVHARYLGGETVGEGYETVGPAVPLLVARGLRILNQDALD